MHLLRGLPVLIFTILTVTVAKGEDSSSEVFRCAFPNQQIYSHEARKCVGLVNGPCSIVKPKKLTGCSDLNNGTEKDVLGHDNSTECIPGAVCKQIGLFGYCTCKPGMVDTADKMCALIYGQSCNISSEVQCDKHTLLGCIEGKCDCENPTHEFNAYSGLCMGKVGAFCKNLSPEQEESYIPNHDYVICGYGAFCQVNVGVKFVERFSFAPENEFVAKRFGNGVCRCNAMSGYEETDNRTCEYTWRIYESGHVSSESKGESYAIFIILGILVTLVIMIMLFLCCHNFQACN